MELVGQGIAAADIDGSGTINNIVVVLPAVSGIFVSSLALDVPDGKVYWTSHSDSKIHVANIDGSGSTIDLYDASDGVALPRELALDLAAGKIYWVDTTPMRIRVGNIDGTGVPADLFDESGGLVSVRGFALDVPADRIYWTDAATNRVQIGTLDGTGGPLTLFDAADGVIGPNSFALHPQETITSVPGLTLPAAMIFSFTLFLAGTAALTRRRKTAPPYDGLT